MVEKPCQKSWWSERYIETILCAAAVLSVAVFIVCMYRGAFYFPFLIDDAFTATVAKNWALGDGFSSSYGKLRPFDPEITTGPGLLLPLALAIKVFGQEVWVARAAPLTWNLGLFALFLWRLRSWLPLRSWLWLVLILPLWYSRFSPEMWFTPLGDITAFLYLSLAAAFASDALESGRRSLAWVCGLFAGLALLTKTVSLTAIAGLFLLPLVWAFLMRNSRPGVFLLNAIAVTFLVLLPWEIYKALSLHHEPLSWQVAREIEAKHIFFAAGSGIAQLIDAWNKNELFSYIKWLIVFNGSAAIADFSSILNWKLVLYSVLFTSIVMGVYWVFSFTKKEISRRQLALFLPAMGYLIWFFCFSWNLFDQHFLIGFSLLFLPLSFVLVRHWLSALAVSVYLVVAVYSNGFGTGTNDRYEKIIEIARENPNAISRDQMETWIKNPQRFFGDIYWPSSGKHPMSESLDTLLLEIHENWPQEKLAGCDWALVYEIEYRLPGSNRVVDCRYLIGTVSRYEIREPASMHNDVQATNYRILEDFIKEKDSLWLMGQTRLALRWTGSTEFLLVLGLIDRLLLPTGLTSRLAPFCSEPLYDDGIHTLVRCRQVDLEAFVESEGGVDFYLPQWKEELSLYKAGLIEGQFTQ